MNLSDLVFSDLFVADTLAASWYKATPDSLEAMTVPSEDEAELMELRRHLETVSAQRPSNFRVDWPDEKGVRLRVERVPVAESKVVYVCRRFRLAPGPLTSLGMPPIVADELLAPGLKDGLVVFLGKAGSGKTTTAASFVSERLARHGGVCWTIENPIELPLQGKHGLGWCYQTEVPSDDDIGRAVRNMLRATPNLIFIGELRDGPAIREAIAASTSGHLVVATFHASDLVTGLARFARLAGDTTASAGLADALKVGMHLSLHNAAPGSVLPGNGLMVKDAKGTGIPPRVLSVQPLWMSGELAEGLRSIVRSGDMRMLTSEVERQRRSFMMPKLP